MKQTAKQVIAKLKSANKRRVSLGIAGRISALLCRNCPTLLEEGSQSELCADCALAQARQAQKPEGGIYFTEPEARLLRLLANYLKRSYASADEIGQGLRLLIERTKL